MRAKQYIYTSWKNGSSQVKGFMVYSMSEGITKDESTQIQSVLKYAPPSNLPYSPTEEEIKMVFPRGFAYFKLSSGRYCIGRSYYIGKDYSGRLGNYIIHAFVFDDKPDFDPFDMIHSDYFKDGLTEEEAEGESNPPPLPEIDIRPEKRSADDLVTFFKNGQRTEILKKICSSVIYGISNNKTVYLYDAYPDITYWFEGVFKCLPSSMLDDFYFSTFSVAPNNMFRLLSLKPGGNVNYSSLLSMGELAFKPQENVVSNKVPVSGFVNRIVDVFADSPDRAKAEADGINDFLQITANDIDFAIKMSDLKEKNFDSFKSSQEFTEVVKKARSMSGSERILNFNDILSSYVNEKNADVKIVNDKELFSYICDNYPSMQDKIVKKAIKDIIVETVSGADCAAYYKKYCESLPFDKNLILNFISMNYGSLGEFSRLYGKNLFTDYFLSMMAFDSGSEAEAEFAAKKVSDSIKNKDVDQLHAYYDAAEHNRTMSDVIDAVVYDFIVKTESSGNESYDLKFKLKVIGEAGSDTKNKSLIKLIKARAGSKTDCEILLDFAGSARIRIDDLAYISGNDPAITAFIDSCKVESFLKSKHNPESLRNFYNEFYSSGKDKNGILKKAVIGYLDSLKNYKQHAEEAAEWADFAAKYFEYEDRVAILRYASALFDADHCDAFTEAFKTAGALNKSAKLKAYLDQYYYNEGQYPDACKAHKYGDFVSDAIKGNSRSNDFLNYCQSMENSSLISDDYVKKAVSKYYTQELVDLYRKIAATKDETYTSNFVKNVYIPLSDANASYMQNDFRHSFVEGVKKGSFGPVEESLIPFLNHSKNKAASSFLAEYFMTLHSFKAKKLIELLKKNNRVNTSGQSWLSTCLANKAWKRFLFF